MSRSTTFSAEDDVILKRMKSEGAPTMVIARELNKNAKAVDGRWRTMQGGHYGKFLSKPKAEVKWEEMTCLACQEPFLSWDKARNRLCRSCGGVP